MRNIDELRDAADVYEHSWTIFSPHILHIDCSLVRLADPTNNDAKMKLAEIYEIMGEPRKALDLVYEVIDSRKKKGKGASTNTAGDASNTMSTSLFAEDKSKAKGAAARPRLTHAQLREMELEKEKEVIKGYRRLKELWAGMLNEEEEAEREWLVQAEKLVDMFRETRNLFLTSRVCNLRSLIILSDFPCRTTPSVGCSLEVGKESRPTRLKRTRKIWLLGSNLTWVCILIKKTAWGFIVITLYVLERDSLARKSARSGEKHAAVNVFRGINFDDWLRLFMQVHVPLLPSELALNPSYLVLLHFDETGSIRCCRRNPSAYHGIQRVSAKRAAGFHPVGYR